MEVTTGKTVTYYVVQTYSWHDGEIIGDEPKEVRTKEAARRAIENLPASKIGGLSFSRTGDPITGEFDAAVVIAQKGSIPSLEEEFF